MCRGEGGRGFASIPTPSTSPAAFLFVERISLLYTTCDTCSLYAPHPPRARAHGQDRPEHVRLCAPCAAAELVLLLRGRGAASRSDGHRRPDGHRPAPSDGHLRLCERTGRAPGRDGSAHGIVVRRPLAYKQGTHRPAAQHDGVPFVPRARGGAAGIYCNETDVRTLPRPL